MENVLVALASHQHLIPFLEMRYNYAESDL